MKISYQWLGQLVPLTLDAKQLAEKMTMVGLAVEVIEEVGDDFVLDFDLTSNRPDALSHLGIAREAAVVCGTTLTQPQVKLTESSETAASLAKIEIHDAELCHRYAGRIVRGVKVAPSPQWLIDRLVAVGQRSVNNIADITNYVMFELGQPTHAFDLNTLHNRHIIVRRAQAGEELKTLDGVTRKLHPDMLVIADADRAVALAGVMGGEETEISDTTTDVLIESAYFLPASVRATSRALGLDSEASYRFARGIDPSGQARAADRVAELIAEIAGGEILAGVIDVHPTRITREAVSLRESRVEKLTGLKVGIEPSAAILRALEFEVEVQSEEKKLSAIAPPFRVDIAREEDLVEEVARHVGYENIATTLPEWGGFGHYLEHEDRRRQVRRVLMDAGFHEAISFSFVNHERDSLFRSGQATVALTNPIDVNAADMRASLLTGLLDSLQVNFNHGNRDVKLFEVGKIFAAVKESERPVEHETLSLVMTGAVVADDWREQREVDYYDLKGAVENLLAGLNLSGFTIERASVEYLHPGQAAVFVRDGEGVATLGRLHPRIAALYKFRQPVYVAEIKFGNLLELVADTVRYSALPRFPSASRDVSALLPESATWGAIETAIGELGIREIVAIKVFDRYQGKGIPDGLHSLAFRITYRSDERTLTDEEANALHERVREMLAQRFAAQLR